MKPAILSTPSDFSVKVVRTFNSSIDVVWRPFTDVDLVRRWMVGPPGWSMPVCEMDFQVGGTYENVFRNESEGMEISISGTFREIEVNSRIVQDESHVIGAGGHDFSNKTVVSLFFEVVEEGTIVTTLIEYESQEQRDEALGAGMEAAMEIGYSRIDNILEG